MQEHLKSTRSTTRPLVSGGESGVLLQKCAWGRAAIRGECAQCNKNTQLLRRSTSRSPDSGGSGRGVPPIVDDVLRSPGRPLDSDTGAFCEPRFGHDFGGLRVHADDRAAYSARAVNAVAYTVGHQEYGELLDRERTATQIRRERLGGATEYRTPGGGVPAP